MPYPQSVRAMREHYVPDWGKPIPEGVTSKRAFKVRVETTVSYRREDKVTVSAWSREEAGKQAESEVFDRIWLEHPDGDIEIDEISVQAAES